MRNAIRSGIFGLISTVLLFAVPAVIFFRACRAAVTQVRMAAAYGLCYIAAVFCFGLNTDVFSLKYLASFYGLMIAQTTAQVVWASRREIALPQR
jgi:O-antigen ligase